jgi:ABC-2 type transport system permease protein
VSSDVALVGTQIKYEQKAYWRNPLAAVFTFGFPLILFVILVVAAGGQHDKKDFVNETVLLKQYYTPSVLAYGVMSACFLNVALTVTRQREFGVLKRLRGTPLPAWGLVGGIIGSAVIVGSVLSLICVLFATLGYNVKLPATHILPLVVTIVLATFVFCALGIAASTFIPNVDSGPAIINLPYFVMVFISGTYFPITGGLEKAANYLPLRPFISAMFLDFDPGNAHGSGWAGKDLLHLAIWGAIGVFVAVRRFNWMPRKS